MIAKKNVTGVESFRYLRKQLDMGISLSRCINKLPIENGEVYSFVPKETLDKNLYNFDQGGIYPISKKGIQPPQLIPIRNDSRSIVLEEIKKHLNENETNCCIFENPNAAPYFPWVKTSGMEYVHLNNEEMFFFFDNKNNNDEKVEDAFSTSEAYIFLCVLSSLAMNSHFHFAAFKEISIESLELFVENTTRFFVKAYDGEGYLMWVKK